MADRRVRGETPESTNRNNDKSDGKPSMNQPGIDKSPRNRDYVAPGTRGDAGEANSGPGRTGGQGKKQNRDDH